MTKYTLRVDRIRSEKRLDLVLEYDSDNLDIIYSILWQNKDLWLSEEYIINIYDIDSDDGVLFHFPEV